MEYNQNDDINYQDKFPGVWGQHKILKRLAFLLEIQNNSGFIPPILIVGQLGSGKNMIGNAVCRNLVSPNKKAEPKKAIQINCSTLENTDDFFTELIIPHVANQNVTVVLDEFHCLHKTKVIDTLLSIWNTENYINTYTYDGQLFTFDFRKISWIALTSESHLIPKTLLSRMEVLELEELKLTDLAQIVNKKLKKFEVENQDLLLDIATYGRKNGRECYKLGQTISEFLSNTGKQKFTYQDWDYIKSQLGLRKDGINNIEYRILSYLKENKSATLTKLASALQLTSNATRQGFEGYLLANDYLQILPQKGRTLTVKAMQYLDEVKD